MSWDQVWDVASIVCFVLGTVLTLAAAVGLVRFPDLLSRLHATAKPQVLGLSLMMLGLAAALRAPSVGWTCLLIVLFQLITAPISAHLAARAGHRTGQVDPRALYTDEYRQDLARTLRQQHRMRVEDD